MENTKLRRGRESKGERVKVIAKTPKTLAMRVKPVMQRATPEDAG